MKWGIYYHESLAHAIVYHQADEMQCTSRANAAQNWKEEASGLSLRSKGIHFSDSLLSACNLYELKYMSLYSIRNIIYDTCV